MTDDEIYIAVEAYLNNFTSVEEGMVKRGYPGKRVTAPPHNRYIVMTLVQDLSLDTPGTDYKDFVYTLTRDHQGVMNIDFFGPLAKAWADNIVTVSRDTLGCDFLKPYNIQPLYCDDSQNNTVVSGEKEYVPRWTVQLELTYKTTVSVNLDGFSAVNLNIFKTEL